MNVVVSDFNRVESKKLSFYHPHEVFSGLKKYFLKFEIKRVENYAPNSEVPILLHGKKIVCIDGDANKMYNVEQKLLANLTTVFS